MIQALRFVVAFTFSRWFRHAVKLILDETMKPEIDMLVIISANKDHHGRAVPFVRYPLPPEAMLTRARLAAQNVAKRLHLCPYDKSEPCTLCQDKEATL